MTTIPTFTSIKDQLLADLATEFNIVSPIGKLFLTPLAFILAGIFKLAYLHLAKVQRNIAPDLAETEARGGTLERFGRIKLGKNPYPAVQAQYAINVTVNAAGTIPASTTWKSDGTVSKAGKLYVLDADVVVVPGVFPGVYAVTVRALEAGMDSFLTGGDTLTVTAPLAIAENTAVYDSEVVAPVAAQSIEEYRQKILQSDRLEPQGGAASDYRLWGQDAPGVKQIYPYTRSGYANELNIFVEATIADSTDGLGTPSGALLLLVEACCNLDPDTTLPMTERGRRPLNDILNVQAIVLVDLAITITNYIGRTAGTDAIIVAALTDAVANTRPFIDATDALADKNDKISVNTFITAIMNVLPASVFDSITMTVDGVPASVYTFDNGRIPTIAALIYA